MQRQPVLGAQAIAAAVSSVIMLGLAMLVSLGVISLDTTQMGTVEAFVGAVATLAILIVPQMAAAFWSRGKVTPMASPRMPDGEPAALVRLEQ